MKKKADRRTAKEKQAAENRTKFGRTKAEKARDKKKKQNAQRLHEGNKIETLFQAPSEDPSK